MTVVERFAERAPRAWMLWIVLHRELTLFVRYPVDAIGQLVMLFLLFALIFVGGTVFAVEAITQSTEGVVVGYFLWMIASMAYVGLSQDLRRDASWGTLERHYMTPHGFEFVMAAKSLGKVVRILLLGGVVLVAMMLLTGTSLHVDVVTVGALLALTLAPVLGIGFAIGGVTLLYKRIGGWTGLLQFAFVGLVSAPALELGWTRVLPLAQGSAMLQRAMKDGVRLWEFPASDLGVLVAVAVGYLAFGYVCFTLAQRRARDLGVLGHY